MARTAQKKSTKQKKDDQFFIPLVVVLVSLLTVFGALLYAFGKQADILWKYELIEKIDNQACRYLDRQISVNGDFDLDADAPKGTPKLTYRCLTGEMTASREIQGKQVDSYAFGASVQYFATNEEAEKYAEEQLNPLRYWGVDAEGQQAGIPQTSRFTFIVSDEKAPYFDAYTVKANAVLRVSLPCGDPDVSRGGVACYAEADAVLQRELKGINVL